jgi:hypothetical protein
LQLSLLQSTAIQSQGLIMGVASGSDYSFLSTHGFFKHYANYRNRLVDLAQQSYADLHQTSRLSPQPYDLSLVLEVDLVVSVVFIDLVSDLCATIRFPNPRDPFWPDFFAGPVARWLVDNEWHYIVP